MTKELTPMTMIDGLPVKTPVVDIVTVGAGGGSIAWVDDGGLLRVGPQSAEQHLVQPVTAVAESYQPLPMLIWSEERFKLIVF